MSVPANNRGKGAPDVVPGIDLSKLRNVNWQSYLLRFLLGAAVSVGAALIAKAVSPRFGGMFLAFPSILPASLTLVQDEDGTRRADRDAIGAILGGLALAVFAGIVELGLLHIERYTAVLLAFLAWLVTSFGLYGLLAATHPEVCDKNAE